MASVVEAFPAVLDVTVGKHLRVAAGEHTRRLVVFGLLSVFGVRLVGGGVGIL